MKKFKNLLVALVVMFAGIITVNATPEVPEYGVIGGKNILLANGTEITIKAPKTAGMGALVTWEGGEVEVATDTTIFGGKHNSTAEENTKITMEGGTVKNIFGGGLHISKVASAEITINGGTITGAIMGGGYEEFTNCTEGDFNVVEEADVLDSTTRVENVTITVNGGTLNGAQVYGGGGAHAYTGTAKIVLNDYEGTISYLTAGGSNGYTESASIEMNDGKVGVLQGINRGTMDTISIKVKGGEITNAYVGGENDPSVTGKFNEATMEITAGKVTNLMPGTNASVPAAEEIEVVYHEDTVENVDEDTFAEDTIIKTIALTIKFEDFEETTQFPKGYAFTEEEIEELKNNINKEVEDLGLKFEDFYIDEECTKKLDLTQPIEEDTTVFVKFTQLREDDGTKNPETSDISVYGIIAALLIGTVGLGYTIKKRRFN